jgi:hypothetical protein
MSTKQPEALRLAAALDELFGYRSINTDIGKVASELRRLHWMNEQLSFVNQSHEMHLKELLEALSTIAALATGEGDVCEIIAKRARAAITKATKE